MKKKDIVHIIEQLKVNPVFQMSLGSKELFHSNFLAWIFDNRNLKDYALAILNQLPGLLEEVIDISKPPEREKLNIDLTLDIQSKSGIKKIIIENKVKSLPQKDQLLKYSEKTNTANHYILLSLSEPAFEKLALDRKLTLKNSENIGITWHFLSYSDLSKILEIALVKVNDGFEKQLLEYYISFIKYLDKIAQECNLNEDDLFDFHDNDLVAELGKIRIKDLYLKKKYESLSVLIYKKLKSAGFNVMDLGQKINWKEECDQAVFVTSDFTNSMGLSDVKFQVASKLSLGIQIQGEQYRMVVRDMNSDIAEKIKEDLEKEFWFQFKEQKETVDIFPKDKEKFNKYNKHFYYRYVKLGKDKKVSELVDCVVKDIVLIKSSVDKVKLILEKHNLLNEAYSI